MAEADDESMPVAARAARVYLDVCFLHPSVDGNARSARLALDHVLTRAGLRLRSVESLFVVRRASSDAEGACSMARTIEQFAVRVSR